MPPSAPPRITLPGSSGPPSGRYRRCERSDGGKGGQAASPTVPMPLERRATPEPLVFFTHGEVGNSGALVRAGNKALAYQIWERIFVQ